jgi:taurine dioxygenase
MPAATALAHHRLEDSTFGVEVERDLSTPLSEEEQEHLRALYDEHYLLVFRGQYGLSLEAQSAVMGVLDSVLPRDAPIVSNVREDGVLGTTPIGFHSDNSYTAEPVHGLSLLAIDVVDGASSTRFANGVAAYASLPDDMREQIESRSAVHVLVTYYSSDRNLDGNLSLDRPHASHPIVMVHPRTGDRLLYVTALAATRVEGLSTEDSEALLTKLFERLYTTSNVYEHVWHMGDLVIWDNVALQHARGEVSTVGNRTLQRVSTGTKDFFDQIPREIGEAMDTTYVAPNS